jgi:curved DNA-binding protein CbpA
VFQSFTTCTGRWRAITKKANEAYEVLSNVDRKRQYDERFTRKKPSKNASPPPTAYKPPAVQSEPEFYSYAGSGQFSWDHMSGKTPRSHGDKTYRRHYPGWGPESRSPHQFNPEPDTRKRARCEEDDNESPPPNKECTEKNPLRWSPLPPRRWTALGSRFKLPRQPQPKPSSPDLRNSLPKADGIAVLDNEINIRILSWDFSIMISDKYVVLGDVRDMMVKDMHSLIMALGIVLEKNKDWTCGDTKDDVQLNIRKTPSNRDVASISSLLKYEIRKNAFSYSFSRFPPHRKHLRDLPLSSGLSSST